MIFEYELQEWAKRQCGERKHARLARENFSNRLQNWLDQGLRGEWVVVFPDDDFAIGDYDTLERKFGEELKSKKAIIEVIEPVEKTYVLDF